MPLVWSMALRASKDRVSGMTWQEKFNYLKELDPDAHVVMYSVNEYGLSLSGVEIGDGHGLVSPCIRSRSVEGAIELAFAEYTITPTGSFIVIDAYKPTRRELLWHGDGWVKRGTKVYP